MYEPGESKAGQEAKVEYVFPSSVDSIQEFTVIDVRVTSSNNQTEGGYCLKLQKVSIHDTTLYSYFGPESLLQLPSTDAQAKELGEAWQTQNPFIHNNLESSYTAFFTRAPDKAYISASPVAEGASTASWAPTGWLFLCVPCVDICRADLVKLDGMQGLSAIPTQVKGKSAKERKPMQKQFSTKQRS